MTEQELVEIEKDMQSNNGSWVSNEIVIKLINEVRKLQGYKPCCQKKSCGK